MQINIKQAQILRQTAAKLIKQAELLEAGIDINQCVHGEYTNEPFTGCKTCGNPKTVICSYENIIGKKRNGNLCNPQSCKYFQSRKLSVDSMQPDN